MVSFIIGVIVGVVAGWYIPKPEIMNVVEDKIKSRFK